MRSFYADLVAADIDIYISMAADLCALSLRRGLDDVTRRALCVGLARALCEAECN